MIVSGLGLTSIGNTLSISVLSIKETNSGREVTVNLVTSNPDYKAYGYRRTNYPGKQIFYIW